TAILLILLPVILIISLMTITEPPRPAVVSENWQYRHGDSGRNEQGIPLWVYDRRDSSDWTAFSCPGQPPGESDSGNIWLRTVLPSVEYKNPCIMFTTNDQLFQVYLEDKLIYSYGDIENHDHRVAPGSPWHLIHLPEDYEGKTLYLRMHTLFLRNTGFVRRLEIGSENEHITYLIASEMGNVLLVCLFTFLGLCLTFIFAMRGRSSYEYLALGFFSICIGTWLFAETDFKQLFFYAPRFWLYVAFLSFYLMPVGFLKFVEGVFSPGNIYVKMMYRLHIFFAAVTLLLDITRIKSFIFTLQPYYVVLGLSIVTIFVTIAKAARAKSYETNIFVWGFSILTAFGIYDILGMYFRAVPWTHYTIPYGMFVFMLSMIYILGKRFADVYDQLRIYSDDIETKNEALSKAYQEVNESRNKLSEWNKGLEQSISERTASIRNLLDHAGQGFLTFGPSLSIAAEYSSECSNIFSCDIAGKAFPELIYPEDDEENSFITTLLNKIFSDDDNVQRKVYMSLLPEEFALGGKSIRIDFKFIESVEPDTPRVLMAILTDITEKRQLEEKVEQEHDILKMVVKVITNNEEFTENLRELRDFCHNRLAELLDSNSSVQDILYEICRAIHTFKGTFCLFDMSNTVSRLHAFEAALGELKDCRSTSCMDRLRALVMAQDFESWLDTDMEILRNVLGDKFLSDEDTLVIRKKSLKGIEDNMLLLLPPEQCRLVIHEIRKLCRKPIKDVMGWLPDSTMQLADRMNKLINPIELVSEEILVDPDRYQDFARALVHVFRNIIDHGLEEPEERLSAGKSEYCSIGFCITLKNNNIIIKVSDDGRGFDFDCMRRILAEKNLLMEELACDLDDNEALQLFIDNHLSTAADITYISGRGLGLSAVRAEAEKLGGTMVIESIRGKGTTFVFSLPCEAETMLSGLSAASIMKPVVDTAKDFVIRKLKCEDINFLIKDLSHPDCILLRDFSCALNIRGVINGIFLFTIDKRLAVKLLENVFIGKLTASEYDMYIEDLLTESANIIIGNSLKRLPDIENLVIIEPPLAIKLSAAELRHSNLPVWSYDIESEYGRLSISFLDSE
ncbi:MAG TPA: ATP-binding protein, partial [Negativicutes bacterium]|nr:ATP-binding protein [Negativicutes bacterium]